MYVKKQGECCRSWKLFSAFPTEQETTLKIVDRSMIGREKGHIEGDTDELDQAQKLHHAGGWHQHGSGDRLYSGDAGS
jgi:hypothetical protein